MKKLKKQTVRFVALLLVTVMLACSLVSCTKASEVDVLRTENTAEVSTTVQAMAYGDEEVLTISTPGYWIGVNPDNTVFLD